MTTASRKQNFFEDSNASGRSYTPDNFNDFQAMQPTGSFITSPPAATQNLLGRIAQNYANFSTPRPVPTPSPTPAPTPTPTPVQPPVVGSGDVPSGGGSVPSVNPPNVESPDDEVVVSAPREPAPTSLAEALFPFLSGPSTKPLPRRTPRRPVRRSPPKPNRTPRRITRPFRPRIPIPVPDLVPEVRVIARAVPFAGLAALAPLYIRMLGWVDTYGTEHAFRRMFPPIPGKKTNERTTRNPERQGNPDKNPAGDTGPTAVLTDDLDTVVVTGTRPRPVALDSPLQLVPLRSRGFELAPDIGDASRPNPSRNPRNKFRPRINPTLDPRTRGKPYVLPFAGPDAGTVPNPTPAPSPSPSPRPTPSPAPRPSPSPSPSPVGAPSLDPSPLGAPSGGLAPQPHGMPTTGPLPLERRCSCRIVDPNRKPKRKPDHKEHGFEAEIEAEYKTKFGSVKIEGSAKKYCVRAKGQRRICYTPDGGLKLPGKRRVPSVGSAAGKLINKIIKLARRK